MGMFNMYDEQAKQQASPLKTGLSLANLSPGRGTVALAGQAGEMMGQGAMGAMGFKTPAQDKQAALAQVQAQFPDPKTTSDFMSLGNALRPIDPDRAEKAFDQAEKLRPSATDSRGGAQKDIEYFSRLNSCSTLAPGSAEHNACMQKSLKDAKSYKRSGADESFDRKYAEDLAKATQEKDTALIVSAESAVAQIIKTNTVLDLLDEGEINTGIFAEFKNDISRVLAMAGSDVSAGYASRTQLLEALLGSDVFPMISSLGIGARGLDTVAERKFLLQVMTGEKTMEASTIKEMTKIRQRLSKVIIEKYNAKVKKGGFKKYDSYTGEKTQPINLKSFDRVKTPLGAEEVIGADGQKYMFDPKTGKMYKNNREVSLPK